jgi:hypothetical protein
MIVDLIATDLADWFRARLDQLALIRRRPYRPPTCR